MKTRQNVLTITGYISLILGGMLFISSFFNLPFNINSQYLLLYSGIFLALGIFLLLRENRQLKQEASAFEHDRDAALQQAIEKQQLYSLQLETSATVSREITSLMAIDDLLTRVVHLIRDTFNYYHVHIGLVQQNEVVMIASTGIPQNPVIHVRLDMPCLNTRAVQTGKPVLVNNAAKDRLFLYDPRSPETMAELVIPLKIGERIIGTMDITSREENAFTQQDVTVFSGLADQAAIAIDNSRLYSQSRSLVAMEERNKLARNLHDSVTQSLSSLHILVEGWRRMIAAGKPYDMESLLERVGQITDYSQKHMRMMIHELRPNQISNSGLMDAIYSRLEMVEKRFDIETRILMEDYFRMPALIEEELYWITHEALNNSLKHSSATKVIISFKKVNGGYDFNIEDDGQGFDFTGFDNHGGFGLNCMWERAQQIDVSLSVDSKKDKGTAIRIHIPESILKKNYVVNENYYGNYDEQD